VIKFCATDREATMNINATLQGLRTTGLAVVAALLIAAPTHAMAAGHFGGGAIGHAGGVGVHGGAFRAGPGYRGGYGWRGGYGYGWRGGYWGGYGFGWGWPAYGLFLGALPFYYSTVWWNGVPYYYADDSYYIWNGAANGYQSVPPPGQAAAETSRQWPQGTSELYAYPKNAQSDEQQARDKQDCRNWASAQAGSGSASPTLRNDNLRAQTACLEARGYSVK
jgi:hypothetical protein